MSDINVLDASAILAYLLQEKGQDVVDAAMNLRPSWVSAVNLCEVIGKLLDHGMAESKIIESINSLQMHMVVFDRDLAVRTATLRPVTRSIGASLGDRACLALAAASVDDGDAPTVFTAEKQWAKLKWPFKLVVIR